MLTFRKILSFVEFWMYQNLRWKCKPLIAFSSSSRCAQKIVTQLEIPLLKQKGYKYEKLSQKDDEEEELSVKDPAAETSKRWWTDKRRDRTKSEERIDNKKNEIVEKQMEMTEKLLSKSEKQNEKNQQQVKEDCL